MSSHAPSSHAPSPCAPSLHAHPLTRYGWDAGLAAEFAPYAAQGLLPGRVVRVDRGRCDLVTQDGAVQADTAFVTPRDPMRIVCTGDWAAVDPHGDPRFVRTLLQRRTAIVRSTSSKRSEAQVLAANVDHIVICVTLAVVPDLERVERLLALALAGSGRSRPAEPLILLTKADLAIDADQIREDVESVAPGVEVLVVSAPTGLGMDALAARLTGTGVLVGQSGAGKSTIANTLLGSPVMDVRRTRVDGKGRHTSTSRDLHPLPGGGVLIDTPGLRGVGLYDAADGVRQVFAEIEALAEGCRFADCRHLHEPDCAVQQALADGRLTARRLESHRKLVRENAWIASRSDARMRTERLKRWKAAGRH